MGNLCTRVQDWRRSRRRLQRLQEKEAKQQRRATRMSTYEREDGTPSIGNSMFVIDNPGVFADFYDMEDRLGEGSYARVCFCRNRYTAAPRAVKICDIRRTAMREMFYKELKYIKMLDHPNIVRLYEHFEDERYLYMVLELCSGGELFDRLLEVGHFSETQTATIMQHVLMAVRHMHERRVCHRDLKIENWILRTRDPIENNRVKACDFNLATEIHEGEEFKTKCGIPYFVAPQVLTGKYDQGCDLWSCGVLMYTLLCGYPPFYGQSDAEILSRVKTGVYTFDRHDFLHVSEDCKDLIKGLLKVDPAQRLTAMLALNHKWFRLKIPERMPPLKLKYLDNLRAYGQMSLLKKASLLAVANNLDEESTKPLVDTFMWLDDTGEGSINEEELRRGIDRAGFEGDEVPADLSEMMASADIDGGGDLNYSEFVAACLDYRVYSKEEVLWGAFRIFDRKGFGRIGPGDLRELWGSSVSKSWCSGVIQEVAGGNATFLDFEGFSNMMKGNEVGKKAPKLNRAMTKDCKAKRIRAQRMSAKVAARLHDVAEKAALLNKGGAQELAVLVGQPASEVQEANADAAEELAVAVADVTVDTSPADEEQPRAPMTCPGGHEMIPLSSDVAEGAARWICDGCDRHCKELSGATRWRCSECDYDLCGSCHDGAGGRKWRGSWVVPLTAPVSR